MRFDPNDIDPLLSDWRMYSGMHMGIRYKGASGNGFWWTAPYSDPDLLRLPFVGMHMNGPYVESCQALELLSRIHEDLYGLVSPIHGRIEATIPDPRMTRSVPPTSIRRSLYDIYWINFFGPPYVEMFGEGKLRSAPCHEVKRMVDGGYMLTLTERPLDSISREGRHRAEAVKKCLGYDYFWRRSDREHLAAKQRRVPEFDLSSTPATRRTPLSPWHRAQVQSYHVLQKFEPDELIREVPQLIESLRQRIGAGETELDCSMASVTAVDSFVRAKWMETTKDEYWNSRQLWKELAAYIGEAARRDAGGEWAVKALQDIGPAAVVRVPRNGKRISLDPIALVGHVLFWDLGLDRGFADNLPTWLTNRRLKIEW